MRSITLIATPKFSAIEVLRQVAQAPSGGGAKGGVTVDQMRKDIRLLDAIDAAQDDTLQLEDADWAHLVEKLKAFPFAVSDRDLLALCDGVINAEQVKPPK